MLVGEYLAYMGDEFVFIKNDLAGIKLVYISNNGPEIYIFRCKLNKYLPYSGRSIIIAIEIIWKK